MLNVIQNVTICLILGPYIKWFLKELGPSGLHKMLSEWEDKSAYAISIFGYADGTKDTNGQFNIKLFEGLSNFTTGQKNNFSY